MNSADLAQRGSLLARLAQSDTDVQAAQQLRYQIFYEERHAQTPTAGALDADQFDAVCDHLLLFDGNDLIGTYRLLRQDIAERNFGFYSESEFSISPLLARKPDLRFLELGRSCVKRDYRSKNVVEVLWQAIWNYVRQHKLDVMFGCASFDGIEPTAHKEALSFLAHSCAPPPDWQASAHEQRRVAMNMMPAEAINQKKALVSLPPLIKGYLRLGCWIGDGAVVDEAFNTVDVLIILPVSRINPRYFDHFGGPGEN